MANIAEGFERGRDKEFAQFRAVAKGSCGETRSLLVIARDQNYIADSVAAELDAASRDISRMIGGLQSYLSKSHKPGRRLGGTAVLE
jgi:four helix bundle protein